VTTTAHRPAVVRVEDTAAHGDVDEVIDFGRVDQTARIAELTPISVTFEDFNPDPAPIAAIREGSGAGHTEQRYAPGGGSRISLRM
jgi:hypothetical protein